MKRIFLKSVWHSDTWKKIFLQKKWKKFNFFPSPPWPKYARKFIVDTVCKFGCRKIFEHLFKKSVRFKCFTHQISKGLHSQDSQKCHVWSLVNISVRFYACKQKVYMPPFAGYGLRFFLFPTTFLKIAEPRKKWCYRICFSCFGDEIWCPNVLNYP